MTEAETQVIASVWGRGRFVPVSGHNREAAKRSCIERGWLIPAGAGGTLPSGVSFTMYRASPEGLKAREKYLLSK